MCVKFKQTLSIRPRFESHLGHFYMVLIPINKEFRAAPSVGGIITTQLVLTQGELPEEGRKKTKKGVTIIKPRETEAIMM